MCAGNFAKCLGGTLTLLSVIAFTANILLFFPGGKEVDIHHLSEEVWFFGGILGSGLLVSGNALKLPYRRFRPCPSKIGYLLTRKIFSYEQKPKFCMMKSVPSFFPLY